ncbi:hypothetical protein TL16_g08169 [Triparma laevis f. inornata]|uniref:Uncharacterized protein n=1 Tax=Triparma laevis f. inornata TaxID=1714386 RepID=A0A9W7AUY2_9STRA|nr:hypothetical protein TL16_g08169 [Triparma laevis f. inornata]
MSSNFLKILTSNNEELTYIKSYFNLHSLPINFWLSNLKDLEGLNDFYLRKIYSSLIIQGIEEAGPNAFRIKVSLALEVCKELWPKSFNVLESLLEEGLIFKNDLNCLPPGILKFKLTGSWEYPMSLVWGGEFVGVKASQDYKVYAELLRVLEIEERLKIELPEIKNLLITLEIPRPIITDSAWEAIKTKKYFEPKFLGEDEMNLIHLVGLWCERDEEVREAVGGWLRGEKGVEGSGSAERGEGWFKDFFEETEISKDQIKKYHTTLLTYLTSSHPPITSNFGAQQFLSIFTLKSSNLLVNLEDFLLNSTVSQLRNYLSSYLTNLKITSPTTKELIITQLEADLAGETVTGCSVGMFKGYCKAIGRVEGERMVRVLRRYGLTGELIGMVMELLEEEVSENARRGERRALRTEELRGRSPARSVENIN